MDLLSFYSFFCSAAVISTSLSSSSLICFSASFSLLLIPSSVVFSYCISQFCLVVPYIFSLFSKKLLISFSVHPFSFHILWSSLQSLLLTLSWMNCLSLCHLLLWGFILFLHLKHMPSVTSFCLNCYVYFYECGRLVTFLNLVEVALCRKCPVCPNSALPS